jgi:hypothetical protein
LSGTGTQDTYYSFPNACFDLIIIPETSASISYSCLYLREWRRLHNEEFNDLYSSPNIIRVIKSRRMRWAGHVARMGEGRGVYRVLVGRSEGRRPLGRPRRRWEDNIKIDLQEVGWGAWTGLIWLRIGTGGGLL